MEKEIEKPGRAGGKSCLIVGGRKKKKNFTRSKRKVIEKGDEIAQQPSLSRERACHPRRKASTVVAKRRKVHIEQVGEEGGQGTDRRRLKGKGKPQKWTRKVRSFKKERRFSLPPVRRERVAGKRG